MLKYAHPISVQVSAGTGGPVNVPAASLKPAGQLGVAVAEFHEQRNVLSIDLLNTFPEWFWQGEKLDFKDIQVGVLNNGKFTQLATLPYTSYAQANYEKAGGIVDLPVKAGQAQLIRDGLITFEAQPSIWVAQMDANGNLQQTKSRVILTETPLTAQTDRRGIYLNEGETTAFRISVKSKGKLAPGTNVLVVKYNPPDALGGPVNAVPTSGPQVVDILNGTATVISVTPDPGPGIPATIQTKAAIFQADAHGIVTVNVKAANPGFPVLVFYPYAAGQPQPAAPAPSMR